MAGQYSTRDFFRQIPNRLLAEYFRRRELLTDLDFACLREAQPDELFARWLDLPDAPRSTMESEFRAVFAMGCEKGFTAIRDEAEWQLAGDPEAFLAFVDRLSALSNHYERAMATFLDYRHFWRGATRFYHADSLHYWRKRKNLPQVPAALDDDSVNELAQRISAFFRSTEGRGRNCLVECFRRGEKDYFFAYPEDYSAESVEWVGRQFGRRPHNPAFEVVFVFAQLEGTLDLYIRGARKAVEPLQNLFAIAILKLNELPSDSKDERVYDLNPLRDRHFNFVFDDTTGIEDVAVKKMRLSSRLRPSDRFTVESDPADRTRIYDFLDERCGDSLHLFNVTQVELSARVRAAGDEVARTSTIRITHPNSCSLKYDPTDLVLREMLRASGIEPREISHELAATAAAA